jgi:hypothetical protein
VRSSLAFLDSVIGEFDDGLISSTESDFAHSASVNKTKNVSNRRNAAPKAVPSASASSRLREQSAPPKLPNNRNKHTSALSDKIEHIFSELTDEICMDGNGLRRPQQQHQQQQRRQSPVRRVNDPLPVPPQPPPPPPMPHNSNDEVVVYADQERTATTSVKAQVHSLENRGRERTREPEQRQQQKRSKSENPAFALVEPPPPMPEKIRIHLRAAAQQQARGRDARSRSNSRSNNKPNKKSKAKSRVPADITREILGVDDSASFINTSLNRATEAEQKKGRRGTSTVSNASHPSSGSHSYEVLLGVNPAVNSVGKSSNASNGKASSSGSSGFASRTSGDRAQRQADRSPRGRRRAHKEESKLQYRRSRSLGAGLEVAREDSVVSNRSNSRMASARNTPDRIEVDRGRSLERKKAHARQFQQQRQIIEEEDFQAPR